MGRTRRGVLLRPKGRVGTLLKETPESSRCFSTPLAGDLGTPILHWRDTETQRTRKADARLVLLFLSVNDLILANQAGIANGSLPEPVSSVVSAAPQSVFSSFDSPCLCASVVNFVFLHPPSQRHAGMAPDSSVVSLTSVLSELRGDAKSATSQSAFLAFASPCLCVSVVNLVFLLRSSPRGIANRSFAESGSSVISIASQSAFCLFASLCLCASPVTSYQVPCFQSALFGNGSLINPKGSGSLILQGNAPSVLSLTSVAEPREDAAPDLRNPLSLVFSVSLCLCGELSFSSPRLNYA